MVKPDSGKRDEDTTGAESALEEAGLRATPQRRAVLAHLRGSDAHPTVDEIFQAVREAVPRISLATVYNTVDTLVEAGLAKRLEYGDASARYDGRCDPHYHVRDVETGEVRDLPVAFDASLVEKLGEGAAEALEKAGLTVVGHHLEVLVRGAPT